MGYRGGMVRIPLGRSVLYLTLDEFKRAIHRGRIIEKGKKSKRRRGKLEDAFERAKERAIGRVLGYKEMLNREGL